MDINMEQEDDFGNEVCSLLFNKLQDRAKEVKEANKDIVAYLYYGCFADDTSKVDFYLSKGFVHEEGTHLLELRISDYHMENCELEQITIKENPLIDQSEKEKLIELSNDIFLKTMDLDLLNKINENEMTMHYTAYQNNEMIGHIIIYAEKTDTGKLVGKIENLFVVRQWRHKNIAKGLMDMAMEYFKNNGIEEVLLEVWSANKVAYGFYEKLNFRFIKETELYPGVYL